VIDFVATREGIDKDTQACARLLTAIISLAIKDACKPPNSRERRGKPQKTDIDRDALSAILFLFDSDEHSNFSLYASLIGVEAPSIRRALLEGDIRYGAELAHRDFRILEARLAWSGIDYHRGLK